jgi:AcrR family transcriptional regulator
MARPRSGEIDSRILDAALAVLSREGYARMSIEAVAAEAGVSRPTVYLRYASKAALAAAAVAAFRERDLPARTGDARADLIAQLRHFRRGIERPYGVAMIGTVLAEEPHTPELIERFRERVVAPRRAELRAVLAAARNRGELRADADLDAAVSMLVGSYYASRLAGRRLPRGWPAAEVDAVLSGLAPAAR